MRPTTQKIACLLPICLSLLAGCGAFFSGKSKPEGIDQATFSQPFTQAAKTADNPPPGVEKPLDKTFTGKPVHQLLSQIRSTWDSIELLDQAGQPRDLVVVFDTELGQVEITLSPKAAPNHVRNFLALVKTGYFDGMRFERVRQEEVIGAPELSVSSLEAGCPAGLGNTGGGNLGYWLHNETAKSKNDQLEMQAGVVGACLNDSPDTACCRFFVLLADAPSLKESHTAFGRVSKGFSVIQAIAKKSLDGGADGVEPTVIQGVKVK